MAAATLLIAVLAKAALRGERASRRPVGDRLLLPGGHHGDHRRDRGEDPVLPGMMGVSSMAGVRARLAARRRRDGRRGGSSPGAASTLAGDAAVLAALGSRRSCGVDTRGSDARGGVVRRRAGRPRPRRRRGRHRAALFLATRIVVPSRCRGGAVRRGRPTRGVPAAARSRATSLSSRCRVRRPSRGAVLAG